MKSIATSWTLQPGDVALLRHVAGELLWRRPCFHLLVTMSNCKTVEKRRRPGLAVPLEPPLPVPRRGDDRRPD